MEVSHGLGHLIYLAEEHGGPVPSTGAQQNAGLPPGHAGTAVSQVGWWIDGLISLTRCIRMGRRARPSHYVVLGGLSEPQPPAPR